MVALRVARKMNKCRLKKETQKETQKETKKETKKNLKRLYDLVVPVELEAPSPKRRPEFKRRRTR